MKDLLKESNTFDTLFEVDKSMDSLSLSNSLYSKEPLAPLEKDGKSTHALKQREKKAFYQKGRAKLVDKYHFNF